MIDVDAHRGGDEGCDQVLELRVRAERVHRVATLDAPTDDGQQVGRLRPVRIDPVDREHRDVGHLRCHPDSGHREGGAEGRDLGPLEQLGADLLGRPHRAQLEHLDGLRPVRGPALGHELEDVGRHRRAGQLGQPRRDPPARSEHRPRDPPTEPHGLPHARRAGTDDVERPVDAEHQRGDHRPRRVLLVEELERRVGERGHRDDRQPQQPAERRRDVRAGFGSHAQRGDREPWRRPRSTASASTSRHVRPYGVVGATGAVSSGTPGRPRPRP